MRSFLAALAFLTILPIRFRTPLSPIELARSRFWYPAAGLILGTVLGGCAYGLNQIAQPAIAAFFLLVVWVAITGALHLDGVADTCDGLFGGRSVEERLQIMRDPHLGSFGAVGLILILLGKYVALAQIADGGTAAIRVGLGVFVARSLVLAMAGFSQYARPEGTGKFLIDAAKPWEAVAAVALTISISAFTSVPAGLGVVAVVLLATWSCRRRLGGATGDTLGFTVEVVETTWLLACAATHQTPFHWPFEPTFG